MSISSSTLLSVSLPDLVAAASVGVPPSEPVSLVTRFDDPGSAARSDERSLVALGESTVAYEIACRFFPRFRFLPPSIVDAIRSWAPLFEPGGVLLSIRTLSVVATS